MPHMVSVWIRLVGAPNSPVFQEWQLEVLMILDGKAWVFEIGQLNIHIYISYKTFWNYISGTGWKFSDVMYEAKIMIHLEIRECQRR